MGSPSPHDPSPRWGEVGIHGIHRAREWDAVVTVDLPALGGDEVEFVALADGRTVTAGDEAGLAPAVAALDASCDRPYRGLAVRRSGSQWAAGARAIEVVELPSDVRGDELELTAADGERSLVVDGMPSLASVPALERLGERRGDAYVVTAVRLVDRLFALEVTPL